MTYRHVNVEREGPLTLVTIDRPEVYNALHLEANLELEVVFDDYLADDAQWVAIITGAGSKAFCAGLDLKWSAAGGGLTTPKAGFGGLASRSNLSKPVIAAVNGVAFGGGFEIALACDIVVASPNAVFALPEPRVGLAALAGGIQRLPREIGWKRAMGILLTGRRVGAAEALQLGFVNELADDPVAAARRWAADILACSPLSIRATKAAALAGVAQDATEAMDKQHALVEMRRMLDSHDAEEGPKAFSEKRAAVWTGR